MESEIEYVNIDNYACAVYTAAEVLKLYDFNLGIFWAYSVYYPRLQYLADASMSPSSGWSVSSPSTTKIQPSVVAPFLVVMFAKRCKSKRGRIRSWNESTTEKKAKTQRDVQVWP